MSKYSLDKKVQTESQQFTTSFKHRVYNTYGARIFLIIIIDGVGFCNSKVFGCNFYFNIKSNNIKTNASKYAS